MVTMAVHSGDDALHDLRLKTCKREKHMFKLLKKSVKGVVLNFFVSYTRVMYHSQPDNLVPQWKFQIITIIHFFKN